MPKDWSRHPRENVYNGNYDDDEWYGRNQNQPYSYENRYNYLPSGYYGGYDTGYHSNYGNHQWRPRNDDEGNYGMNYSRPNRNKRPSKKQSYVEQKQTTAENKKKKPHPSANNATSRHLAALDKTANVVTNNNKDGVSLSNVPQPKTAKVQQIVEKPSNITILKEKQMVSPKKVQELKFHQHHNDAEQFYKSAKKVEEPGKKRISTVQSTTVNKVDEEGHPKIAILNEITQNQTEEVTKQPRKLNFREIREEAEMNYKSAKYAQKVEDDRENDPYNAAAFTVFYEGPLEDRDAYRNLQIQKREDLIQNTKKTRLYKLYKEQVKKTVPKEAVVKTPDVSIEVSRWKEHYFKPWKLDLAKSGYRFLDTIECSDTEDTTDQ